MKKFNLEQALAGKPVVTRSGREVEEVIAFKSTELKFSVFVKLKHSKSLFTYTIAGIYTRSGVETKLDLFMDT